MNGDAKANTMAVEKMPDLMVRIERIQMLRELARDQKQICENLADRIYGAVPMNDSDQDRAVECTGALEQMDMCLDDLERYIRGIKEQVMRLQNL